MRIVIDSVFNTITNSESGSRNAENMIGRSLRFASIAALNKLDRDSKNVTNEELKRLSKRLGVSDISLLVQEGDDIVIQKSSDPKEIGLGTKEWGYWYTAFNQLFTKYQVTIPEGQALNNYWAGPINTSLSNPDKVVKYGYYYDGTTNYILNPYINIDSFYGYQDNLATDKIIHEIMEENEGILEITGYNPDYFGEETIWYTAPNGTSFIPMDKQPILFGDYWYRDDKQDEAAVKLAMDTGDLVSYVTEINGEEIIKHFYPMQEDEEYVVGIVEDYHNVNSVLHGYIVRNVISSSILILFVFVFMYLFSARVAKPVLEINEKVKEISKGNFGVFHKTNRKDELGALADGVNQMSTYLANYKETIEFQAYHDDLTGLPNRRLLQETLNKSIGQGSDKNTAVLFFDLDRFKFINDTFGHTIGDELLKEVGNRVQPLLENDQCLYRTGGDEFVIFAQDRTRNDAENIAKRIIQRLSEPFIIDGYEIVTSASIGISIYPDDAINPEEIFKNTDVAMYRAKENGKNQYCFYNQETNDSLIRKAQLEKDLHKAVENQEFVLHYQPQINIQTMKMTGVEALVRWNHPELGTIAPSEFIPLAEESGLINPLGEWIVMTAARQMKEWTDVGCPAIQVAVNLSAKQFQQGNLVNVMKRVIQETGIDPNYLELEITEGMAMIDHSYTNKKLKQLKTLGVKISLDDFGTGYSSLNYLKSFPIDKLKIDKSFVNEIEVDKVNEMMVSTIITMAHHLNLRVIAEGVENESQLNFLKQENCDEVQGYYFGKPMVASELEEWLENR